MNRTLLIGRLTGNPLHALTAAGQPVATVHVEPVGSPPRCAHPSCRGVPCLVLRSALPELQRWHEQGYLLKVEGELARQVLWYEDDHGRCMLQLHAERCSAVDPEDYRREAGLPAAEGR